MKSIVTLKSKYFSLISFFISLACCIFYLVLGIIYISYWYFALVIYYLILVSLRLFLFLKSKIQLEKIAKLKLLKKTSVVITIFPLTIFFMLIILKNYDLSFSRSMILIYYSACYTTYKMSFSIVNFIKAHKRDDDFLKALRNINLVDALVSLLSLQIHMLLYFSPEVDYRIFDIYTGGIISLFIFLLGLICFISSQNKIVNIEDKKWCLKTYFLR